MKPTVPTLFLFNSIFYPNTVMPITVNDDISKEMLLFCFEKNIEIALYHPHPHSISICTVGTILSIENKSYGNLSVMVQGLKRIKLLEIESEVPFPKFHFEDYNDYKSYENDNEIKYPATADISRNRLYGILLSWVIQHTNSANDAQLFMTNINSIEKLINNLCFYLLKDIELKQIFLQSRSLSERLQMMNLLLIGDKPELENTEICEAIKKFERLGIPQLKNVS